VIGAIVNDGAEGELWLANASLSTRGGRSSWQS